MRASINDIVELKLDNDWFAQRKPMDGDCEHLFLNKKYGRVLRVRIKDTVIHGERSQIDGIGPYTAPVSNYNYSHILYRVSVQDHDDNDYDDLLHWVPENLCVLINISDLPEREIKKEIRRCL